MGFKVTYRTREKLQRAIKQTIVRKGLVDTRTMLDSIRISSGTGDIGQLSLTINCIYYYVFLDLGTVNIAAQNITQDALNTGAGQDFLNSIYQEYVDWISVNYPILDNARLEISKFEVLYNTFGGGEYGYPDGIYNPNKQIRA